MSLQVGEQASLLGEDGEPDTARQSSQLITPNERREPRTLEKLIMGTWEGLVRGTSLCPVCGGRLEPQLGAHARPVAGRCADCGSTLS